MSKFDLNGRVAIVTGSSKGIGKAVAEDLATLGAKVVISSRKQDACDAVAAELNARFGDGTAIAVAASISDKPALQRLVDETRAAFGSVDVLVCNAATNPHFGSLSTITDEQFAKILTNNVVATNWLVQMVAPEMVERQAGSIVIVASTAGLIGTTTIGGYSAAKAAAFQLVRALAAELGEHGVRVNAVAPGATRTEMARPIWEDPAAEAAISRITLLRRLGEPGDIAGAVAFLASDASRHLTGQALVVDGGATVGGVV